MHKRHLHHYWTRFRTIPALLFLAISVVFLAIGVYALRVNNLKMLELREAVFMADESDGDIEIALRSLREQVHAHMNTNLSAGDNAIYPPIQLQHRYERLVAAEKARVESVNALVYTEAQNYCEQQNPDGFSGGGRVPCIKQYVDSRGTKEQTIPDALYKFDFVSPTWSPDLAGWSLVISIISFTLFLALLASERWLHNYLRDHS